MSSPALPQFTERPLGLRERPAVTFPGLITRQDGSTADVQLTDLSCNGFDVETSAELESGERIELSLLGRAAIPAKVRWCSDGRAGFSFEAAPSAGKPLPRRGKRLAVATDVTMRRAGYPNYRVHMFDLSLHGCSVEIVDRPGIDELVWIKFDGLEALETRVCWVVGNKAGLKYANAIHPAVFDLLLARIGGGRQS